MVYVRIKRRELIWDKKNTNHIAKHNLVPLEVEEVFKDKYKVRDTYSERLMIIGKSAKRLLSVVIAREKRGYYIITARDSSKKERNIYRNEKN